MNHRPDRDVVASLVVGIGSAALVLGLTAAIVLRDYDSAVRRANEQLDLVGQSLVEDVRRTIHSVELLLISAEGDQSRLAPIASLPGVIAVGVAASDPAAIAWSEHDGPLQPDRITASLLHAPQHPD